MKLITKKDAVKLEQLIAQVQTAQLRTADASAYEVRTRGELQDFIKSITDNEAIVEPIRDNQMVSHYDPATEAFSYTEVDPKSYPQFKRP